MGKNWIVFVQWLIFNHILNLKSEMQISSLRLRQDMLCQDSLIELPLDIIN